MSNEGLRVIKAHRAVAVPPAAGTAPAPAGTGPGPRQGVPAAGPVAPAEAEALLSPPAESGIRAGRPHQAAGLLAAVTLEEARRRAEALEARACLILAEAEEAGQVRRAEAEQRAREILRQAEAEAEALRARVQAAAFAEGRAAGYRDGVQAGRDEARGLVAQARQEAEQMLAAARSEAEQVVASARAEAGQLLAAARHEAETVRRQACLEREQLLAALEPDLVRLAVGIARQILQSELALRPEAIVEMVAAALAKVRGDEHPKVRLHPEDHERVQQRRRVLLAALGSGGDVELVADPGLAPGGFILHTDQGTVDGRLEVQLGEVAAALDPAALTEGDEGRP